MQFSTLTTEDLSHAASILAQKDKALAQILEAHGPPPLWRRPATFTTLVRIILEQQVSLKSADSMFRKIQGAISPFTPESFVSLGTPHLRALGVTRQKATYLLNLSSAFVEGGLNLRQLQRMSDIDVKTTLMRIKGLGSWSSDVYLLMAMRRADVWPVGDLALAVAVKELNGLESRPGLAELEQVAEMWKPYRAVAARMLWQYYLARRANGNA